MELDPKRKKVVFIMKKHQQCPIFTECGTMVAHWPMLDLSESSGCCAEAVVSFLPGVRDPERFANQEFECSLETCRGFWVMSEEESGVSGEEGSPSLPGIKRKTSALPQIHKPFLESVPPYIASSLTQFATPLEFEAGQVILEQGVETGVFYVLKEGVVEIVRLEPNSEGEEDEVIVGELARGDCFGEMSLLTGDPSSACVRAKLPSTILTVEKDDFYALMQLHPEFSIYLTRLLADRIRLSNLRFRHMLDESMVGRIGMVPIFDLVQHLHQAGRSGVIEMRHGGIHGGFGLSKGHVIFASSGDLDGEEAFYDLCSWKKGTFAYYHEKIPPRKNISRETMQLLLAALQRIDEACGKKL